MPKDSISFTVDCRQGFVECFIQRMESFGEKHCLPPDLVFQLTLSLDEVVTNIINHGYVDDQNHAIKVSIAYENAQVIITVSDDARHFNPLTAPPAETDVPFEERRRQVGGMGIHLVKTLMDEVKYAREGDKNVLTMTKRVKGNARKEKE